MNILLLLPFTSAILISLGNLFFKKATIQHSLINFYTLYAMLTGVVTFPMIVYSFKKLPLWQVSTIVGIVSILTTILLGIFILNESISMFKFILILLNLLILTIIMVIE